ncbi:MobA/MobL family protein [Stenotrophomonas maltophilia]|uniref:MobA/MobL family protein n=1 Tax=Stenotrophomonas maltophilia TaxID=40324 RepID=UPI00131024C4|nr:MobA/MobL family protein [Stenotrophomonas maltophilia]
MAIYHSHMKSFGRGKGDSSVAAAAYRAGFDLVDEATGLSHSYSRRHGVDHAQMLAPHGSPAWCLDTQKFWNANEAAETRKNALVAREVEVALPQSLDQAQRKALALDLGQLLVDRYKVAVLVAIHTPSRNGDQRNHHVHLLMSARQIGPQGFGRRAGAVFDGRQGEGSKAVKELRLAIAATINRHLDIAGIQKRVDPRKLKTQAREAALKGNFELARELTRTPGRHNGKVKTALERKSRLTWSVQGLGGKDAAMKLVATISAHQAALINDPDVPEGHSHAAALRDQAKAAGLRPQQAGEGHPRDVVKRVREHLLDRRPVAARSFDQYSRQTLHLSRVQRITRASGRDAEVLNAEAKLIEDWLEAQREVAQDSLELLRSVPGIQIEPEFQLAHASILCRRVDDYAGKAFTFEDTEVLARSLAKYAHMMARPHRARMALLDAQAKLSEHLDEPKTQAATRARQRVYRAKTHVSPRIAAIQQWRIDQARKRMTEAKDVLDKHFMDPSAATVSSSSHPDIDPPPARADEAGNWEHKMRGRRPTF